MTAKERELLDYMSAQPMEGLVRLRGGRWMKAGKLRNVINWQTTEWFGTRTVHNVWFTGLITRHLVKGGYFILTSIESVISNQAYKMSKEDTAEALRTETTEFHRGLADGYPMAIFHAKSVWMKLARNIRASGQSQAFTDEIAAGGKEAGKKIARLLLRCNKDNLEYAPEAVQEFANLSTYDVTKDEI